ncbi:hypothetical protein [Pseudarthrobacter sp. PS3-L1]|uniref:hypothetical protein n=1 Tax=Pseudarthrobacter sp. PS3-L1 TaxID=3046207 RepID=UPI0024BAE1EA|nr:hypothetical protein [Pseudarthrobacter sp. PS3-L1]MDJ0319774.1 hypothetical protein [Pseudarthrobacter sp. PS3-L1]
MTYTYKPSPDRNLNKSTAELLATERQINAVAATLETKRAELRKLRAQSRRLDTALQKLGHTKRNIQGEILAAEARTTIIEEQAYEQIQALAERAYLHGQTRAEDHLAAKAAAFHRALPNYYPQRTTQTQNHQATT